EGAGGDTLHFEQTKAVELSYFHDRISVLFEDAFIFLIQPTHLSQSEEEYFIDFHQLISPELVLVEDVGGKQFRSDAPGKIFQTLPRPH
ncbi:MAG: hypothetical protein Q9196_007289, partial [Gyalolechia fulgens]